MALLENATIETTPDQLLCPAVSSKDSGWDQFYQDTVSECLRNNGVDKRPLELMAKLKIHGIKDALAKIQRAGWVIRGYGFQESVWDHTLHAAAVFCTIASDLKLSAEDIEKGVSMLLVHDIGEIVTGDLTSYDKKNVAKIDFTTWRQPNRNKAAEKIGQERKGMESIIIGNNMGDIGEDIMRLWDGANKLEENRDSLGQLVKDCDVLSVIIKARILANKGVMPVSFLNAFREQSEAEIKNDYVRKIALTLAVAT